MQEELKISLYDCLYGTEIQRFCLDEYGVRNRCMRNAIEIFKKAHHTGVEIGPVNLNEVMMNCVTGEVEMPEKLSVDEMFGSIDTIKCLPPEVISERISDRNNLGEMNKGNIEKNKNDSDDNYYLALLLFIIRYNAFPFDGKLLYEKPVVTKEQALKLYTSPVFIFDDNNTANEVYTEQSGDVIKRWYHDENLNIKTLFLQMFTLGIRDRKYHVNIDEWEKVIEDKGGTVTYTTDVKDINIESEADNRKNNANMERKTAKIQNDNGNIAGKEEFVTKIGNEENYIETDGIKIGIIAGREIYERDLGIDTQENKKICVVVKNNKDERVLALGNCTDDTWSVYLPNTKEILVMPNHVAPVVKGSMISIGELIVNII